MLITIEGIDYSGKSTQASWLASFLTAKGKEVVLTREPGGTVLAERIRSLLIDGEVTDSLTAFLCLLTARYDHYMKVISPALKRGLTVISNRFFDSTVAYQGYAGGVDLQLIYQLHEKLLGTSFYPDITIILAIDELTFLARSNNRRDAFEKNMIENKSYLKIIEAYKLIASSAKRYREVDATQSIQMVQASIQSIFEFI